MFINKKLNIQLRLIGELSLVGIVVLDGNSSDQAALVREDRILVREGVH